LKSASRAEVREGIDDLISPEVQALLDHARVISPLPRDVRARALARARAALEAAAAASRKAQRPVEQVSPLEGSGRLSKGRSPFVRAGRGITRTASRRTRPAWS